MSGEDGLACIRPGVPFHLAENVWYITTSFYYFNIMDIQNNGLLLKEGNSMVVVSFETDLFENTNSSNGKPAML